MLKFKTIWPFFFLTVFSFGSVNAATGKSTLHKFINFEMGYGTFNFDEKLDHKLIFPVANISMGLAYKRFSYVLNASGSISDADVSEEEQYGNASRKDYDLTVGYQINKVISVFTGYKDGKTELTLINRDPLQLTGGGDEFYKQSGPYIGANINWRIPKAGKLAFTISYAKLNSENLYIKDGDEDTSGEALEFDDISGETQGNTDGFSYTFSWTVPIKGSLIFRTRLRINQYQQDISYFEEVTSETYYFNNVSESSTMLLIGVTSIF